MAFRFSLASVLKIREELEKKEERVLEQRRETLARLRAQLAQAKQRRVELGERRLTLLRDGLLGDDLNYCIAQERDLEQLQQALQQAIPAAVREYEEQMKIFLTARQNREVLEELKKSRKQAYQLEATRREQRQIDEIFVARMARDS